MLVSVKNGKRQRQRQRHRHRHREGKAGRRHHHHPPLAWRFWSCPQPAFATGDCPPFTASCSVQQNRHTTELTNGFSILRFVNVYGLGTGLLLCSPCTCSLHACYASTRQRGTLLAPRRDCSSLQRCLPTPVLSTTAAVISISTSLNPATG